MRTTKSLYRTSPSATIAASRDLAERHVLPAAQQALALKHAEPLRPFAEAALADARHVAFREPSPVPRFMA